MAEEVKVLENHTHLLSHPVHVTPGVCNLPVIYPDLSRGRLLQLIDATKKGALAGTGGSNDADNIAITNINAHIFKGRYIRVLLPQMFNPDQFSSPLSRLLKAFCASD